MMHLTLRITLAVLAGCGVITREQAHKIHAVLGFKIVPPTLEECITDVEEALK